MLGSKEQYSLAKVSRFLIVISLSAFLLYAGRSMFIPMSFGLLLAILSYPSCKYLESKNWPRSLAVAIPMISIILIFALLVWLLIYEINLFSTNVPELGDRLTELSNEFQSWLSSTFGLTRNSQHNLVETATNDLQKNMDAIVSNVLSATTTMLVMLMLIPIFGALFLYHRGTFLKFMESLVGDKYKVRLNHMLHESATTYFKFVKGTFLVYCIVGCLNSVGLVLLGIENAVLYGMVTAFMTIIPYLGIFISAALPVSIALITKDSIWYAWGVIIVFAFVQYLEANVIFPKIVGQQLNLSTWAVLVAIMIGTMLWGISGMILFIPFTGILKIFTDNIEELKPLNILLRRN